MKVFSILLFVLLTNIASAAPTLTGNAQELKEYLSGIEETVSITATANKKASLDKAVVKLIVGTETTLLSDALKENLSLRKKIRATLENAGIQASNIRESKFSSTPEYGIFGDQPKSYTVKNVLSIDVVSEEQMIQTALIADKYKSVYYQSSQAEKIDPASVHKELLRQALDEAQSKADIYAKNLNLQLVPVSFSETKVSKPEPIPRTRKDRLYNASYEAQSSDNFGESSYSLSVTVVYEVKDNNK